VIGHQSARLVTDFYALPIANLPIRGENGYNPW